MENGYELAPNGKRYDSPPIAPATKEQIDIYEKENLVEDITSMSAYFCGGRRIPSSNLGQMVSLIPNDSNEKEYIADAVMVYLEEAAHQDNPDWSRMYEFIKLIPPKLLSAQEKDILKRLRKIK